MDDALLVCGFEGVGNLPADAEGFVDRNWSLHNAIGERRSLDQLHHQCDRRPLPSACRRTALLDAVNRRDVDVVQRGQRPGLTVESGQTFGVGSHRLGQHLDRDLPGEVRVDGAIHLAHAAGADLRGNFVRSESGARGEWQGLGILLES